MSRIKAVCIGRQYASGGSEIGRIVARKLQAKCYDHEIVDMATDLNIIEKSGSWFSYQGDRLGQGRDKVVDLLKENPDLADELESKIMDTVKQQGADAVAKAVSASDPSEDEDLGLPIVSED